MPLLAECLTPALTAPIAPPPSTTAVRILADDLTGACDSAAPFLESGHSVRVWLGAVATEAALESVQAFNTASRAHSPQDAASAVARAAETLELTAKPFVFKKVDSAGRGPIAAELNALHQALGTRAILFAPSFPAARRIVRNGILRLQNCPDCDSEVALASMFPGQSCALISHASQISATIANGATVLLCDAVSDRELDVLAAVAAAEPDLLYAGSAGLARALAALRSAGHRTESPTPPKARTNLTICGTRHPVTQLQLQHLACVAPHSPRLHIRAHAADAPAIHACFERHDPAALILTGGDTALLALATLGANSILLRGELAPGIPWGVIQGGPAHNRVVITKSGGFGEPETLTRIVRSLAGAAA